MNDDPDHFYAEYWAKVDQAWDKNETAQEIVNLRKREAFRLPPIFRFPIPRQQSEGD